jgi:methylated-DNA-[protein]-cysteine S-methyltransferase
MARRWISTPWGLVLAEAGARGLLRVSLPTLYPTLEPEADHPLLDALEARLRAYFEGQKEEFREILLDLQGLAPQRIAVLEEVRRIPYGGKVSYGALGRALGLTPRAVGAALRANPFFLVVPAHRVLHADGRLGGFAGREDLKAWLLEWESKNVRAGF